MLTWAVVAVVVALVTLVMIRVYVDIEPRNNLLMDAEAEIVIPIPVAHSSDSSLVKPFVQGSLPLD
jgi:hypothetical protein